MKVLQINTTVNSGSTGRIAEDIGKVLIANGHESYIAYGRGNQESRSSLIKIGKQNDVILHGLKTAIFDRHGFGSTDATVQLIGEIDKIGPDIVALHNLHGYYINIEVLFDYLKAKNIPVLWTLFDCWAFTGHCSYFDDINCIKYHIQCEKCPKTKKYPASYVFDNSLKNYSDKKRIFTSLERIQFVVHSMWLKEMVGNSFLKSIKANWLPSGIDLELFRPLISDIKKKFHIEGKKVVLGCASQWSERKGLKDFISLRALLNENTIIVLIGVSKKQVALLPPEIIGIPRTESVLELVKWYNAADVFVNPTYQDNFPTTNLESLACGTPVVTYNTGGSPEAIDKNTGIIVEKGDVKGLSHAIELIFSSDKEISLKCRERAEKYFDKNDRYLEYLDLFNNLVNNSI
ncbi:glycosyltransferase [Flavobacterium lacus]|uniref:Glycosyltransferase involved in cell wall biosynthesis n=1 Tax=Flavobacterium lacus TaxID=1353778 RepID=A0A328WTR4_9FLAO|nr:glycosyltransferase [Flavobacterium lacus]RAR47234.1 glycosyltransferase involved in cell wall biosynthesis [Flavobacterium lacus]